MPDTTDPTTDSIDVTDLLRSLVRAGYRFRCGDPYSVCPSCEREDDQLHAPDCALAAAIAADPTAELRRLRAEVEQAHAELDKAEVTREHVVESEGYFGEIASLRVKAEQISERARLAAQTDDAFAVASLRAELEQVHAALGAACASHDARSLTLMERVRLLDASRRSTVVDAEKLRRVLRALVLVARGEDFGPGTPGLVKVLCDLADGLCIDEHKESLAEQLSELARRRSEAERLTRENAHLKTGLDLYRRLRAFGGGRHDWHAIQHGEAEDAIIAWEGADDPAPGIWKAWVDGVIARKGSTT